jgi:hypothetical protein
MAQNLGLHLFWEVEVSEDGRFRRYYWIGHLAGESYCLLGHAVEGVDSYRQLV